MIPNIIICHIFGTIFQAPKMETVITVVIAVCIQSDAGLMLL